MKYLLICLLLLSTFRSFGQESQEIYQRAKISFSENQGLQQLGALGIPIEHGQHKKGHFIISDFSLSELETARTAGYSVDVLIPDSKEYFLQQNRNPQPTTNPSCEGTSTIYPTPANFNLGSMGGYLTYQELLDELDDMRSQYPNLITAKENIHSFLTEGTPDNSTTPPIGGNGIKWVKISDNPETTSEGEPQILYTAIHHAREPASLSQLVFYMWYLLENYDTNPEIKSIVDNTELYFVPVINPDGYLYNEKTDPNGGGFWRKNRKNTYGTDLNRNYDYYINGDPANGVWGGEGTSSNTGSDIYHGPAPFSEVETQAIKWFVENHNFVLALNNHSFGDLLLYPYGYTSNALTPENELFETISSELVSQNGYNNIISSDLYPAAGVSDDFMYGTVNTHDKIYAMTPEIGPSFWPPSNQIIPICQGMMYFNLTVAKMVNNFATITETITTYIGNQTTIESEFEIKRLGLSGNGNFTVSIEAVSNNIVTVGSPVVISSLDLLDIETGTIPFTVSEAIQPGDLVEYDLVVNNGTFDSRTQITKRFGSLETVFEDPGDSVTENFNNNGWGITNTTFVSPSSAITDSPNGNYPDDSNKEITLAQAINLTNALGATASFYAKWDIEADWDYVQFEVSTDNGATWIPQCGTYTSPGSDNSSQPTGEPLYDGIQSEWIFEEINLSDYLGETILVRFQFESDGGVTGDGFYFDDLTVRILEEGVLGTSETSVVPFQLYPNPVIDVLTIRTSETNYTAALYNMQGQELFRSGNNNGTMKMDYSTYPTGIYLLSLSSETVTETLKIVKQ
jgi:hypothetical protein